MVRLVVLVSSSALLSVVAQTPEPYDCEWGYAQWQVLWTPDYKAWCCLNHERGCDVTTSTLAATTSTRATQTATSTMSSTRTRTSSTATRTTTLSPEQACQVECTLKGTTSKCGERLLWVRKHVTQHEANVCEAAAVVVVSDCPEACGGCTAAGAGCGSDPNILVKKYEDTGSVRAVDPLLAGYSLLVGVAVAVLGAVLVRLRARRQANSRHRRYSDVLMDEDALVA